MHRVDVKEYLKSIIGVSTENDENTNSIVSTDVQYTADRTDVAIRSSFLKLPLGKNKANHYISVERMNAFNYNELNTYRYQINPQPIKIQRGFLNTLTPIRHIKRIRLSNFYMVVDDIVKRFMFRHKKLTVVIHELQSQSFVTPQNTKFHFMLEYVNTYDTNNIVAFTTYDHNKGVFEFDPPINYLDTLTISVYDGASLFTLEPTIFTAVPSSDGVYTYLRGVTTYLHNPTQLTISGFSTTDPVTDAAVIAAINTTHTLYYPFQSTSIVYDTFTYVFITVGSFRLYVSFEQQPIPDNNSLLCRIAITPVTTYISQDAWDHTLVAGTVDNFSRVFSAIMITFTMNINTMTLTITSPIFSFTNYTFVRNYNIDHFETVSNLTSDDSGIRLDVDSSAVVINSPTVTVTTDNSLLEMQLDIECEEKNTADASN